MPVRLNTQQTKLTKSKLWRRQENRSKRRRFLSFGRDRTSFKRNEKQKRRRSTDDDGLNTLNPKPLFSFVSIGLAANQRVCTMSTHASAVASLFALTLYITSPPPPPPTTTPPLPPSPSRPPLSLVKAHDDADGPKAIGPQRFWEPLFKQPKLRDNFPEPKPVRLFSNRQPEDANRFDDERKENQK